jgi:hypothetical protein
VNFLPKKVILMQIQDRGIIGYGNIIGNQYLLYQLKEVLAIHNIKSNILIISKWTIKKALKGENIKVYFSYLSNLYKIKKLHVNL